MEYEYKCIPLDGSLFIIYAHENEFDIINRYTNLINKYSRLGWEFFSLERISCIKYSYNENKNNIEYNMLVFRKVKNS